MFKAGRKRTARSKVKDAKGNTKIRRGGKMTRFGVLAAVRGKIDNIYLLTGTPGELLDLWGQIYLLDRGARLGGTQSAYHKSWFIKNPYSFDIRPRPDAEDRIMRRIADVMVSLPPLDLVPPPVFIPVKVKLSPKVMREYREFERTLVSETHDVEAVSKGVLTNKLLQFANGSMYREDRSIAAVHTAKLDALDELIERAAGDPMLVFYGFKFDLDAIRKRHPDAVVLNETADRRKGLERRKDQDSPRPSRVLRAWPAISSTAAISPAGTDSPGRWSFTSRRTPACRGPVRRTSSRSIRSSPKGPLTRMCLSRLDIRSPTRIG